MHHVELVAEPDGTTAARQHTILPLVIRSPKQWLIKKADPIASLGRAAAWPNGIASAMRCCLGGWADPRLHDLGPKWCKEVTTYHNNGNEVRRGNWRRAACEESANRTAWYTKCKTRGAPTNQPTCIGDSKLSCPVEYACRTPVYLVNGQLSSSPSSVVPVKQFS